MTEILPIIEQPYVSGPIRTMMFWTVITIAISLTAMIYEEFRFIALGVICGLSVLLLISQMAVQYLVINKILNFK